MSDRDKNIKEAVDKVVVAFSQMDTKTLGRYVVSKALIDLSNLLDPTDHVHQIKAFEGVPTTLEVEAEKLFGNKDNAKLRKADVVEWAGNICKDLKANIAWQNSMTAPVHQDITPNELKNEHKEGCLSNSTMAFCPTPCDCKNPLHQDRPDLEGVLRLLSTTKNYIDFMESDQPLTGEEVTAIARYALRMEKEQDQAEAKLKALQREVGKAVKGIGTHGGEYGGPECELGGCSKCWAGILSGELDTSRATREGEGQ